MFYKRGQPCLFSVLFPRSADDLLERLTGVAGSMFSGLLPCGSQYTSLLHGDELEFGVGVGGTVHDPTSQNNQQK